MANVKTIGGAIVSTAGVPLPSKTATLKNDDTGTTITTTTTNADGEWEFANRDETIRYRVEAAFGGSSSQVVVRKPASAEFDHLYANTSFRTKAGATVAIGGAMTVVGQIGAQGGLVVVGTGLDVQVPTATFINGNFSGNVTVTQDLTVVGDATFASGATVSSGGIAVTGHSTISGGLGIQSGGLVVLGGLDVQTGASAFINGAFSGNLDTSQDLYVGGDAMIAGSVGFYGTAPAAKPTVTGSRGSNAALTSLLTALANLGLVTNSSS